MSANIRQPPPIARGGDGRCRLCGEPVAPPRRTWCGDRCVRIWGYATSNDFVRTDLQAFYYGCWQCGRPAWDQDGRFRFVPEVDHVRPLWSLTDIERTELRWWLPFNLQLLCPDCHKAKTRREAGERARVRRRQTVVRRWAAGTLF